MLFESWMESHSSSPSLMVLELRREVPNHLQKRKHQLSSLMYDAAAAEAVAAEKRQRAVSARAQARGRYGW